MYTFTVDYNIFFIYVVVGAIIFLISFISSIIYTIDKKDATKSLILLAITWPILWPPLLVFGVIDIALYLGEIFWCKKSWRKIHSKLKTLRKRKR